MNRWPVLGAVAWITGVLIARPELTSDGWARTLLALAALVVVPLGVSRDGGTRGEGAERSEAGRGSAMLLAGLLLALAQAMPRSWIAAAITLPWLFESSWLAWSAGRRLVKRAAAGVGGLALAAARIFLAVGAAWAVVDRLGVAPFGYDPAIVQLTAVHFHFAGFALATVAGRVALAAGSALARAAAAGVVAGVVAVALAISTSHAFAWPWLEPPAAALLALAAVGVAAATLHYSWTAPLPLLARTLFTFATASLAVGAGLAALFGARELGVLPAPGIPWMRAVHGTLNAVGFALPALAAWRLVDTLPGARAADGRHAGAPS